MGHGSISVQCKVAGIQLGSWVFKGDPPIEKVSVPKLTAASRAAGPGGVAAIGWSRGAVLDSGRADLLLAASQEVPLDLAGEEPRLARGLAALPAGQFGIALDPEIDRTQRVLRRGNVQPVKDGVRGDVHVFAETPRR